MSVSIPKVHCNMLTTMPVLREVAKLYKNAILILLVACYFAHSLEATTSHHDVAHAHHSTGGEDRISSPLCQMMHEPACECELHEALPASCSAYCTECVNRISKRHRRRPPHNAAPFDRNYVNLYTPMPDGGLVVSADGMHADLRITSPNQTCKWILSFMKGIRVQFIL